MKLLIYNRGAYAQAFQLPEPSGGAEKQQWLTARALAGRGHEVVVIVPGLASTEFMDGVRFIPYSSGNTLIQLQRYLRSERPDWLYWRCSDFALGPLFFIARSLHISTVFACAADMDCQPVHALARRERLWPLYAWGLRQADRILVQHPDQKTLLPRAYGPKTYQVNNIVEIDSLKKTWGEPGYFAWIGALGTHKRPHLLVDMARALPDARFIVCGEPSDYRSEPGYSQRVIEQFKQFPNIDYRGHVRPAEARAIIANAQALISTTEQEGFPNTFLEAWSSGVPVISMGVDPAGVIAGYGLGTLPSSLEEMIEELRTWANQPDRVSAMGTNGWNYVARHHSAEFVGKQLEAALGTSAQTEPSTDQTTSRKLLYR